MVSPSVSSGPARASIQRHSRSFWFASRLLPANKRADVERLYAWCRWCDDGVDNASSPEEAAEFVRLASADLDRIEEGQAPRSPESRWFASVAERHGLSLDAARALLAGMESDLTPAAGFDEDDLMRYCFRAAGAVGVLMCPILGLRDRGFLPNAAALGMAMQLTNIARDVAEDWRRSRCYLPLEWADGLRPGDGLPDAAQVERGVRRTLDVADAYYAAGELGIDTLARGSRLAVRAASRIYHAIGSNIRESGFRVLDRRARVPFAQKMRLFLPLLLGGRGNRLSLTDGVGSTHPLAVSKRLLLEHGVSL